MKIYGLIGLLRFMGEYSFRICGFIEEITNNFCIILKGLALNILCSLLKIFVETFSIIANLMVEPPLKSVNVRSIQFK